MSEPPVSLEELLKLKRHETPKGDFWAGFERDFQHRRLRALMDGDERQPRLGLWKQLALWGSVSGGTLAVLLFLALSTPASVGPVNVDTAVDEAGLASAPDPAPNTALSDSLGVAGATTALLAGGYASLADEGRSRFVFDAMASQEEKRSFRRVLSNASLSIPNTAGSQYVADPLTTGRSDVTPVAMRARAHF